MSTLKNYLYLILITITLLGATGISLAQSGCWDLSTTEDCESEADDYSCIWRSSGFGESWGWCEKTVQRDCWQYGDQTNCLSAECAWEAYGYCYEENCWDFKDQASCTQASTTHGINCKWETMGTADTGDDYCYDVGCWNYDDQTTCEAASCTWGSQGGWCSDMGCWSYETETGCNTQENCQWEGGSNCRFKSCWDYSDAETCTAQEDCQWDSAGNYCYEMGCWNYDNSIECESTTDSLTCLWDTNNNYCYQPSCYDYSLQADCESTTDDLSCYWDSQWGECHEIGCWSYDDETDCEASTTPECTWRPSGWCEDLDCWMFDSSSCESNPYGLTCSWHAEPHCEGEPSLNCWEYDEDETGCAAAGCEWKTGWCSKPGCWDLETETECTSTEDSYDCNWKSGGWCEEDIPGSNCWGYEDSTSCDAANGCNWHTENWCEDIGCWNYDNQVDCIDETDDLTCLWNAESNNCYKKGCWDYSDETNCLSAECLWDSDGQYCYEEGCWNYHDQTTCEAESCLWKVSGGFCEETREAEVDCWNIDNSIECSSNAECMWETWGSCQDKQACWSQNTKAECEALSAAKRCVWDTEYQNCYEKGCWEYVTEANCLAANCQWDGSNCFYEGCWKYNDQTNCIDTTDSLSCKWKTHESCYEEGCWDYNNQVDCETNSCIWQTSGWCEADTPGAECWEYWDSTSCNAATGCSWNENSWCEDMGPWQYNNEADCANAGFNWKAEGGWCNEPLDVQCWNFDQETCGTKTTCRWDGYDCINVDCWEYNDEGSCTGAPTELGCEWRAQESTGWCEELNCWSYSDQTTCDTHKTDMKCAWNTFGWCEDINCWMLEDETSCLDATDTLDCQWEATDNPEGGMCDPEFGRWDVPCWQYNDETNCNAEDGCRWRTGWCNEPGCWNYDETTCEDSQLHPNMECSWHTDDFGGGWCEELGCWNFWDQAECDNHNADMGCEWHFDPWSPEGGWCEEPGCWSYHDQTTCENAVVKDVNCVWHDDPSGFGGWCEMGGCMAYFDQTSCEATIDCMWRTESHCEKARCWMWDAMNGGDETTCAEKGVEYGLDCTWNNDWCEETYAGCDTYDGDMQGCFDTMFCWWDEPTQECNSPGDAAGGEEWLGELEGERMNPGCWIFDYAETYCDADNYVDVCRWNDATSKCTGLSADAEITCGNIKDSALCESIPILSTCCEWKNNKCQAAPDNTRCYTNIEEPPEGAMFCEDYVAYTDETTCGKIAGSPWFMPCKWDGEYCVFRSEDKFSGEKKGCDAITNKKDCEFAGCEWKTDFYCEGTLAVPFGWCEEKTGIGAKSCDAACWACEYQPDGSVWSTEAEATQACEGSASGYCAWISDPNAPNGLGYCEVPDDVKYMGDCSLDCKACEMKTDPQSACESSDAECKWVSDTTGETTIGGWCYPKIEKSCSEDCFRCYDEVSCVDYGGGSKGACIWESDTYICKPKNFDKEICFNGVDDEGDGRIDCEDSDCFSDPFCGSGMMSECWKYDTQEKCLMEGGEGGCIWIFDPWEDEEWCGVQGENCFLWDGDEAGCDNQPMCEWFPDPMGGFCEVEDSKVQNCFKATTQGGCTLKSDCYWKIDPTSQVGGSCEPKIFKCESKTTQADCTSGEWSSRCAWIIDDETGVGECEPICFSENLGTQATCDANANCEWLSGLCDPAEEFGMKMEDCWKYDNDPATCEEALGCEYHIEMGGGFCDINFMLNDQFCMDKRDEASCVAANDGNTCKWHEHEGMTFCDLKIFGCGWYQDESACNADADNYGGCAWITEGWCECTIPWEQGGCEVGTEHGCHDFEDIDSCEAYSAQGCTWRGPHCEPKCFTQETQESCDSEAPTCQWRAGFCEPKMMKMMFEGMESRPVDLGMDEDGGCGPNSGDENIASELDICGFGVKEMPDNYGFGTGVYSLENAAVCKGKKIIKQGPMGPQEVTDSGTGTEPTKLYLYLDTDGSEEGNCWLWDAPEEEGYEFFFKYAVKLEDGEIKETHTAYRCKDGDWIISDIKLSGWRTLMCSEVGGLMIAVNNDDLKKFTTLFKPGERMRVYVATAGQRRTESNPSDTAGPGYYTPGAVDFKLEDCLTPGVDMDGDGFTSENDPDCFMFYKSGGFIKHEDCFETGMDEDDDGLVDCDDPDCKFAPNCIGKGANLVDDSQSPKLVWKEVEKYPDGAFIRYDTDEPANGTILFYKKDSSCKTLDKKIKDPALLDAKTTNDYKNWHDGPIDNFEFNPQKLGYDLENGTAYYYKLKVCDPSGNCGLSACLDFTTADSLSKRDCPDCYAIVPGEIGVCGVATQKIGYNEVTDIPLLVDGEAAITIENVKGKSFDAPNVTMDDVTTSEGNAGYVGMDSEDYDKMRSKLGAYTDINCTIKVPKGDGGDCDKLWHCPEPEDGTIDISKCEDRGDEATLLDSTDDYCEWRIPCDFSVWVSNPGTAEEGEEDTGGDVSTGGGGVSGGGGGGGVYTAKPKLSCFDGIKNCHDGSCEEEIDCGGPCDPCPSCSDGIQNQGEDGVDCGGPCKACTTTTTTVKITVTTTTTTTLITTTTTEVTTTTMPEVTTTTPERKEIPLSVTDLALIFIVLVEVSVLVFLYNRGRRK